MAIVSFRRSRFPPCANVNWRRGGNRCMNQCMRSALSRLWGWSRSTRDTRSVLRKTRDLNEGTLRWFCATDGDLPTEARCRLHHVLGVEIDVGRGNGDGSLSSSSWPAYLPLMDALKLLLF